MLYIGCDPDLHKQAYACIDDDLNLKWVKVISVPAKLKEGECLSELARRHCLDDYVAPTSYVGAVESQQYYKGDNVPAQALISLATASGIAMSTLQSTFGLQELYLCKPKQWKGTVPKDIHQARTLRKLGIPYKKTTGKVPYCYPVCEKLASEFPDMKKGDWKHAVDAIGLALYAKEHFEEQTKLKKYLSTYK